MSILSQAQSPPPDPVLTLPLPPTDTCSSSMSAMHLFCFLRDKYFLLCLLASLNSFSVQTYVHLPLWPPGTTSLFLLHLEPAWVCFLWERITGACTSPLTCWSRRGHRSCFPHSIYLYTTQSQNPDSTVVGTSQSFLNAECVSECTGQCRSGEVDECLRQSEVIKIGISFSQINSTISSLI